MLDRGATGRCVYNVHSVQVLIVVLVEEGLLLALEEPNALLESLCGALEVLSALVVEVQPLIAARHIVEHNDLESRVDLDLTELAYRVLDLVRLVHLRLLALGDQSARLRSDLAVLEHVVPHLGR